MRKRILLLVLTLALALSLAACGAEKVFTLEHADELLASGAFEGSEMEELDGYVLSILYGIDTEDLVEYKVYMASNSWTSADEMAVLVFADEQAAIDAEAAFRVRVKAQLEVMGLYAPASVTRLENAFISRRGNTVLFAVGDPDVIASVKSIH